MAKQRGIHQISGTVNNLTYYEQKYVRGGLIRRVNEGMSERLKTDPIFKNTRDKNAIFGMCSRIAAAVWQHFPELGRNCIHPSAHARTTRFIYRYAMQRGFKLGDTFDFSRDFSQKFVNFLNSQIRRSLDKYQPESLSYVTDLTGGSDFGFNFSGAALYKMSEKLNTTELGIGFREDLCIQPPEYDERSRKYLAPEISYEVRSSLSIYSYDAGDITESFPVSRSVTGLKFWLIWIIPVKTDTFATIPDYSRAISWFVMYDSI